MDGGMKMESDKVPQDLTKKMEELSFSICWLVDTAAAWRGVKFDKIPKQNKLSDSADMDGGMEMESDNGPQDLTKKMEELDGELKKMDQLFNELKQQIIDNDCKTAKEKRPKSPGESERDIGIKMQQNNSSQDSSNKMDELDSKLKKMKELVEVLKQLNTEIIKRPKTLIEAKEYMSEWCRAEGKEAVDDREIECLSQAHLKNPHLDDEILKWILWASETNSKKIDEARNEMQEVIRNLQIHAQESFLKALKAPNAEKERDTQTKKDQFKTIMDTYHHFQLAMNDTDQMWKLYLVVDILRVLKLGIENFKEICGLHLAAEFLESLDLKMEELPLLFREVNTRIGPPDFAELQFSRELKQFTSGTDLKNYFKSTSYDQIMDSWRRRD